MKEIRRCVRCNKPLHDTELWDVPKTSARGFSHTSTHVVKKPKYCYACYWGHEPVRKSKTKFMADIADRELNDNARGNWDNV